MTDAMIASRTGSADPAAIDRALRENAAGKTIPGEVLHAMLDGAPPFGRGGDTAG